MFALSDARDYSFFSVYWFHFIYSSTIVGARRKDNWPIKLRKWRGVILLHIPRARLKKWPTNYGKTPESRVSFQRLKPGSLPKLPAHFVILFFFSPEEKKYKTSMKHLWINSLSKLTFLGHRVQNVPKNSAKTSLPSFHFKQTIHSAVKKTGLNS